MLKARNQKKYGPYTPGEIFHSKAYRSLKVKHSRYIYDILRSQLIDKKLNKAERKAYANAQGKPGMRNPHPHSDSVTKRNWDDLRLSYRRLQDYWQINRTESIKASFDELHIKGFIDILTPGGGGDGRPAVYATSERWRRWGEPDYLWPVGPVPDLNGGLKYDYETKAKVTDLEEWKKERKVKPKQKRQLIK